ncbi:MAG: glycine cleavage system aminomethyltransferase GcvT [Thermodesulfobacteriota bacterium]
MTLNRTPLYDRHLTLGAKLVDFAGFEMPVSYSSVIKEHLSVRSGVGLFDVSHMGEIEVRGAYAFDLIQKITTNDLNRLRSSQSQYSLMLNPAGGVIDDVIVYRLGLERFLLCVNASNTKRVFDWISEQLPDRTVAIDQSEKTALIALQGPGSAKVLSKVSETAPDKIKRFRYDSGTVCEVGAIISRTGYTGEDGFEFFVDPVTAVKVWEGLLEAGEADGIVPVGLAARDTLRLEMGYPLHGQELTEETTPLEAGLDKFVSLTDEKGDFTGRDVLERQAEEGVKKKLVGLEVTGAGIARTGYNILSGGEKVGTVTSGTHSPSLKRAIAMGYVTPELTEPGTELEIEIRGKAAAAVVTKLPFYNKTKS